MKNKDLKELSWQVEEPEYRADNSYSYSTLAKYERSGFNAIATLKDKEESPSLTFGSMVDCYLTEGKEEFNRKFVIAEFPVISETLTMIAKEMSLYGKDCSDANILMLANKFEYQKNWKDETRIKTIREKCTEYANLLIDTDGKTIISNDSYMECLNCVNMIMHNEQTKQYFWENPFSNIQNYYQLKFKTMIEGYHVRCMFDVLQVDYENKTIQPIDLKTLSKPEWEFHKSFLYWRYDIQARLYSRILQQRLSRDDYFKDFTILDFKFVVINKESLLPIVFDFSESQTLGDLVITENIVLRDPIHIIKELDDYITSSAKVPSYIKLNESNNLIKIIIENEVKNKDKTNSSL